ncbi:hypothetical protein ACI78R_07850 [Geodermatophilus sp. SYSU D01106]
MSDAVVGDLPREETFSSPVQLFLGLPPVLGGEARNFRFNGTRTFRFESSSAGVKLAMSLTDFRMVNDEAKLTVGLGRNQRSVNLPSITWTPSVLSVTSSGGLYDPIEGVFSIAYRVEIPPLALAFLEISTDTLPVNVVENGRLTLGQPRSLSSQFGLQTDPAYSGPLS